MEGANLLKQKQTGCFQNHVSSTTPLQTKENRAPATEAILLYQCAHYDNLLVCSSIHLLIRFSSPPRLWRSNRYVDLIFSRSKDNCSAWVQRHSTLPVIRDKGRKGWLHVITPHAATPPSQPSLRQPIRPLDRQTKITTQPHECEVRIFAHSNPMDTQIVRRSLRNFLLPVNRLWRQYTNGTQMKLRDDYVARLASKRPHSLSLADLVK